MAVILAALLSAFVALCWGTIAAVGAFPADGATAAEVAEQRLGGVGLAIPRAVVPLGNRRRRRRGRLSLQSANLSAVIGGILVFGEPIGSGPLAIGVRLVAFCRVIAGALPKCGAHLHYLDGQ